LRAVVYLADKVWGYGNPAAEVGPIKAAPKPEAKPPLIRLAPTINTPP
jgi:hypothetical protein